MKEREEGRGLRLVYDVLGCEAGDGRSTTKKDGRSAMIVGCEIKAVKHGGKPLLL